MNPLEEKHKQNKLMWNTGFWGLATLCAEGVPVF
jgi:hypothetical protein